MFYHPWLSFITGVNAGPPNVTEVPRVAFTEIIPVPTEKIEKHEKVIFSLENCRFSIFRSSQIWRCFFKNLKKSGAKPPKSVSSLTFFLINVFCSNKFVYGIFPKNQLRLLIEKRFCARFIDFASFARHCPEAFLKCIFEVFSEKIILLKVLIILLHKK